MGRLAFEIILTLGWGWPFAGAGAEARRLAGVHWSTLPIGPTLELELWRGTSYVRVELGLVPGQLGAFRQLGWRRAKYSCPLGAVSWMWP